MLCQGPGGAAANASYNSRVVSADWTANFTKNIDILVTWECKGEVPGWKHRIHMWIVSNCSDTRKKYEKLHYIDETHVKLLDEG